MDMSSFIVKADAEAYYRSVQNDTYWSDAKKEQVKASCGLLFERLEVLRSKIALVKRSGHELDPSLQIQYTNIEERF